MYCYNCGKNVYNGMQHCPYCDVMFDDEILEEMIFANTLKKISRHVPEIPHEKSKTFLVAGNPITILGKEFVFCHVFNYANQLWSIISTQTKKYIDQSYFNQLVKEGETYIASLLEEIIYLSMAYVHKNGNAKISKSMKKRFFDLCDYAEVAWEPVYVAASEFQDLHQALAERRALSKRERSGYWVGGGFGIRGAIKGKIKADIPGMEKVAVKGVFELYDIKQLLCLIFGTLMFVSITACNVTQGSIIKSQENGK